MLQASVTKSTKCSSACFDTLIIKMGYNFEKSVFFLGVQQIYIKNKIEMF
jgi:hypothetical protein